MRLVTEIIIHCTATRPTWMHNFSTAEKVAEVRRWHIKDRGWRDIGYHYLIDRDGKLALGRPVSQAGAHTVGRNADTIAISLFGGYESAADDLFSDNFTPRQDIALRTLLADLRARFPTIRKVSGHNDYAAKACPGFRVAEWLAGKG